MNPFYLVGTYIAPHHGSNCSPGDEFAIYSLGYIHPIARVRWYAEAAELCRFYADKYNRPYAFVCPGDIVQIIQPNLPTPAPEVEVEWAGDYDGVPADTGSL